MQATLDNVSISGPVSAYCYEFKGRRFFFFGDHHRGTEKSCGELYGKSCDRMNYSFTSVIKQQGQCWTILALLVEWFTYNKRNGKKTDFYFEFPYHKSETLGNIYDEAATEIDRRRLGARPPDIRDMTPEELTELRKNDPLNRIGWLGMIGLHFSDCLVKDKSKCRYGPEVRVHYVDTRQLVLHETEVGRETTSANYDYFALGGRLLEKSFTGFVDDIAAGKFTKSQTKNLILGFLDKFDEYVAICKLIVSHTTELFALYAGARGYETYHERLLNLIPAKTSLGALYKKNVEGVSKMTKVVPQGVRMHRTAAELTRLREEVSSEIADAIAKFSMVYYYNTSQAFREQLEDFTPNVKEADELRQEIMNEDELSHENLMLFLDHFKKFLSPMLILLDVAAVMIGTNVMDIYTLSRMFILDDSEEVVVFAGHIHISSYVSFFVEYLKAKKLYHHPEQSGNKRCVSIPELPDILDLEGFRA